MAVRLRQTMAMESRESERLRGLPQFARRGLARSLRNDRFRGARAGCHSVQRWRGRRLSGSLAC